MTVVGIIPARYASTRLPGKPLVVLHGKPMIQWVHERALRARTLDSVLVATDDERVAACVRGFGGTALRTSADHASGTDRIAEVAAGLEADVVVNVQGDEPLVAPEAIDELVGLLAGDPGADAATLANPLRSGEAFRQASVVKVVRDAEGRALYFSRAPIPWDRSAGQAGGAPKGALRHVGLYAFRREALLRFAAWPTTELERLEGLEQLRWLEHGARLAVGLTEHEGMAVDTPADVPAVEARLREAPLALVHERRGHG